MNRKYALRSLYLGCLASLFLFCSSACAQNDTASYAEGKEAIESGNHELAYRIFSELAGKGHARAQTELANLYLEGKGTAKSNEQGVYWLKEAAKKGEDEAQALIGVAYKVGDIGLLQDYQKAHHWLLQSARQGNPVSQAELAALYVQGRGVEKNYSTAVKWVGKAAEQGYSEAQFRYGQALANGIGVPQNYVEAHKWFNLAASQGVEGAAELRQQVASQMSSEQIARAQRLARQWNETQQ